MYGGCRLNGTAGQVVFLTVILANGFAGLDRQAWLNIIATAIVSAIITALGYQLKKSSKTLDYTLRGTWDFTAGMQNFTPDPKNPSLNRIEFNWRTKKEGRRGEIAVRKLEKPRIYYYHIRNTGKQAIDMEDFKGPIEIEATSGSIVDVVVTNVSHKRILNLGPIRAGDAWAFSPALMNRNDWIDIEVITDNCQDPPELSCLIRGESRQMRVRRRLPSSQSRKKMKAKWQWRPDGRLVYSVGVADMILAILLIFYHWLK